MVTGVLGCSFEMEYIHLYICPICDDKDSEMNKDHLLIYSKFGKDKNITSFPTENGDSTFSSEMISLGYYYTYE